MAADPEVDFDPEPADDFSLEPELEPDDLSELADFSELDVDFSELPESEEDEEDVEADSDAVVPDRLSVR